MRVCGPAQQPHLPLLLTEVALNSRCKLSAGWPVQQWQPSLTRCCPYLPNCRHQDSTVRQLGRLRGRGEQSRAIFLVFYHECLAENF